MEPERLGGRKFVSLEIQSSELERRFLVLGLSGKEHLSAAGSDDGLDGARRGPSAIYQVLGIVIIGLARDCL